jgi:hypothetical protein
MRLRLDGIVPDEADHLLFHVGRDFNAVNFGSVRPDLPHDLVDGLTAHHGVAIKAETAAVQHLGREALLGRGGDEAAGNRRLPQLIRVPHGV